MESNEINEDSVTSQETSSKSTKESVKKKKVNRVTKKKMKPKKKIFTFHTCKVCSKQFTDKYSLQLHTGTHLTTYPYSCDLCPYKCKVYKYLTKHIRNVHSGPGSHECESCGKRFRFPNQLQKHALVHTGEKPFACDVCGKSFNRTFSLKSHKLIHTDEKPFQCSFCPYSCRDNSTLRKHQARHMGTEPLYQCKICTITVKNKWRLKTHVAEKHLDLDVRKHECGICGKRYKTKCVLNKHVRVVHEKSEGCTCEYCGVRLANKANLPRHMMKHVNERPYKCMFEGCGKRYKDRTALRKHAIIHYPEQHFACEICDKKFTRQIRLKRHLNTHVPKKKNLQCDYCGVKFLTKNYISKHIRQKHTGEKEKFMCDLCDFVTHNKPSIVMHIKYGHGNENDRECTICKTIYKKHIYLKMHYAKTHGIRYKTKTRIPKAEVEIKEEPEDVVSIDLFEIEKHEVLDELEQEPEQTEETDMQDSSIQTKEPVDEAIEFIKENSKHLKKVPEEIFDEYYIEHVEKKHSEDLINDGKDETCWLDKEMKAEAKRSILKLLVKVRQKREVKALERMRRQYNERMRVAVRNAPKKENIKIKYFNNNKPDKKPEEKQLDDLENKTDTHETTSNETDNNETCENETEKIETDSHKDSAHSDSLNENDKTSLNDKNDSSESDDEENAKVIKTTGKLKCNSHQCYICFKLFQTKEKLLEHCQYHFDVCTSVSLKKCPLCDYVTKLNLSRHMKAVHKIHVKIPYTRIKDKIDNTKGSRYYYEINNKNIEKIELIPSIKNLNKIACMNMEKKNREAKAKTVAKTKLVKKGKEWVVEKEKINVSAEDFMLPEFDEKEIKINEKKAKLNEKLGDSYLDRMKRLSHLAKKNGKKMMFPCENCEKICLNFSGLKLHSRKHDPNKKPFRPKVWKHKLKDKGTESKNTDKNVTEKSKGIEFNAKKPETDNRNAKPGPIVNKHKCDPELKEFYEKNIRGGDIEFWQFLKIYNKMGRDNITDFTDLQKSTEFGIHANEKLDNSTDSTTSVTDKDFNVTVKVTKRRAKTKKTRYKRVIRLSKKEYIRRNAIKDKLRETIANKCN